VAGLGRWPDEVVAPGRASRRELDVLIVGGGRAGLAAAAELSGLRVLVVDDAIDLGGSLRALDPAGARAAIARAREADVELASGSAAVAIYREPETRTRVLHALVIGPNGTSLIDARAIVLATGCHDPALAFTNNDLPGILSARAALLLWRSNVTLGDRVAAIGSGRFFEAFSRAVAGQVELVSVSEKTLERAVGRASVTGIVSAGKRERVDAVIIDGPAAPALELAVQAGAHASFDRKRGTYRLEPNSLGQDMYATGSLAGNELDSAAHGTLVGREVSANLR
jgi:sarcosine oxidase subunit alpha